MKRFLYVILIIILLGEIGFIVLNFTCPVPNLFWCRVLARQETVFKEENKAASFLKTSKEEKDSKIIIFAVGDIVLDRGVEYMVKKQGNGDFKFPFLKVADDLRKADILFGNLESVISDKGINVGSIYSFRADPKALEGLIFAGFDILSVANNHVFDYNREAMEDSFLRLKEAGIDYVGGGFNEEEVRAGVLKEVKGTKIIFLGYTNLGSQYWQATENSSGIGWLDERIKDDIKIAKEKSDLVIVSLHWGEEYYEKPTKEQEYFGHLAIDSGADLVIGHHTHSIQPVEKYQDGWIAYSLGNFVLDQYFSEETMKGLLLEIIIEDKRIKEVNPREIKISDFYQPYFY